MGCDAVIIVGGGQAGFQLAASLRMRGDKRRTMIISEEITPPYQRPPLSKDYLVGQLKLKGLYLRSENYFTEQGIELMSGRRAKSIDRCGHSLSLDDGSVLKYGHLVLATGARNRPLPVPGAHLDGVHQLRTVEDADRLSLALSGAQHIVVIGAGFVGLEFAAAAKAAGTNITVVEAAERPMARALSAEMSETFRSAHAANGISFHFGSVVRELVGNEGRVIGVRTETEILPADLVMVGIGVLPNDELAGLADLDIANGIVVDEYLATSDPDISAIGDCARFPCPFALSGEARIESVQNAVDQARALALRLTGTKVPYRQVPWFWSDQGPLKLQIAGLGSPHDETVISADTNGAVVYCFRQGQLAGVETLNRPIDHMAARKVLSTDHRPTPNEVRQPSFELRSFIKPL